MKYSDQLEKEKKQIELKNRLESSFNFDLIDFSQNLDSESAFFKYLQEKLAHRISFFIRTDMDKLLQALYRIDVDDQLSGEAFELGEIHRVSMKLAQLIIQRQLQKLEYSQNFYKTK